jgi:hypothetical protein
VKRQRTNIGLDVHACSVVGCGLDGETEGRHDLARNVYHGRKGEVHQACYEGTGDQLSGTRVPLGGRAVHDTLLSCSGGEAGWRRSALGRTSATRAVIAMAPAPARGGVDDDRHSRRSMGKAVTWRTS